MNVTFTNQKVSDFVEERVRSGVFADVSQLVEAAVIQMMADQQSALLDDEDRAAIAESIAEFERGEFVDAATVAAEWRSKAFRR